MILVASVELCLPVLCFRCVAELDKSHISSIIECLSPSLSNLYDTDRIVITAFFGQVRSYKYLTIIILKRFTICSWNIYIMPQKVNS